jgi:DNA-binding transcriptional MerR regulator
MKTNQDIPDKLYFRIGEVSKIIGVDAHVLRYWEAELDLKPHRSNSGQRLYRKVDITEFLRIKRLVHDEGYTISGARNILQKERNGNDRVEIEHLEILLKKLMSLKNNLETLKNDINGGSL